jgi:hypothetical protein
VSNLTLSSWGSIALYKYDNILTSYRAISGGVALHISPTVILELACGIPRRSPRLPSPHPRRHVANLPTTHSGRDVCGLGVRFSGVFGLHF